MMLIVYIRFYFTSNENKNEYMLIVCFNKTEFTLKFALKSEDLILH